eukprot:scaffold10334_cov54-Cyclotella_meneghiniana.AAC.9
MDAWRRVSMEETKRWRGLICWCSTSEMYEPSASLIIAYRVSKRDRLMVFSPARIRISRFLSNSHRLMKAVYNAMKVAAETDVI